MKALHRLRTGFTIVELMTVIAVIAVLMTIVTTAAKGALREARERRADALVAMVQQGIETYHTVMQGKWPGASFQSEVEDGSFSDHGSDKSSVKDKSKYNGYKDTDDVHTLSDAEVRDAIAEVIKETVQQNRKLMDVTGLFVTKKGSTDLKRNGLDIMDAVRGDAHREGYKVPMMDFGYPDAKTGYFRPFTITYSIQSDKITVSK